MLFSVIILTPLILLHHLAVKLYKQFFKISLKLCSHYQEQNYSLYQNYNSGIFLLPLMLTREK